ncbi:hypothetical protein JB92DRAFT_1648345 [Gautieria morchelliformis]|nr:hypothetical protein JB92DRAFT_1648345 [Gautieria morchelliformis]
MHLRGPDIVLSAALVLGGLRSVSHCFLASSYCPALCVCTRPCATSQASSSAALRTFVPYGIDMLGFGVAAGFGNVRIWEAVGSSR